MIINETGRRVGGGGERKSINHIPWYSVNKILIQERPFQLGNHCKTHCEIQAPLSILSKPLLSIKWLQSSNS